MRYCLAMLLLLALLAGACSDTRDFVPGQGALYRLESWSQTTNSGGGWADVSAVYSVENSGSDKLEALHLYFQLGVTNPEPRYVWGMGFSLASGASLTLTDTLDAGALQVTNVQICGFGLESTETN